MEQDGFGSAAPAAGAERSGGPISDRLELGRQWVQEAEEQQAMEQVALYERIGKGRGAAGGTDLPDQSDLDSEELDAMTQALKLRQKCQDIAAQILVDELEESREKSERAGEEAAEEA